MKTQNGHWYGVGAVAFGVLASITRPDQAAFWMTFALIFGGWSVAAAACEPGATR